MNYAYMRVSTETQVLNNGIQMQEDVIKKYCEDNNITLDGIFTDLGISGTVLERDGIIDLLSTLKKGDNIIVMNTSRLWRENFTKAMIIKEIQKAGANVVSIEQPNYDIYTKDPNEFLVNSMFELLDQYDRMAIAMKLAKGRKAKANNGSKSCGNVAFGYKWINAEVVIDYNNNLIVQDIFNNYETLGSLQKLADYCIEKGYKTSRGNDFSKSSLKKILNNDFYIGVVRYNEKTVAGTHTPIIDKEQFNRVQTLLSGNRKAA